MCARVFLKEYSLQWFVVNEQLLITVLALFSFYTQI